jgi:ring-1,2-phenylacetyl-CoA epoxidase subunit PaaD
VVTARTDHGGGARTDTAARARQVVAAVRDPELPDLTVEDLGILRDVSVSPGTGTVTVVITPTYTGCPAIDTIRGDIRAALARAGFAAAQVTVQISPAWTTDSITEQGRTKLTQAGIAPPAPGVRFGAVRSGPVPVAVSVRCPRCGSPATEQISRFGSTACKALWRCLACAEPFDHIKAL